MTAIAAKLERYRNPWQELKLQYGANKGKAYTGAHLQAVLKCNKMLLVLPCKNCSPATAADPAFFLHCTAHHM